MFDCAERPGGHRSPNCPPIRRFLQESKHDLGVPVAGVEDGDLRLTEPRPGVVARGLHGKRSFQDCWMGRDTNEPEDDRPRQLCSSG